MSRVAVFITDENVSLLQLKEVERAAKVLGLTVISAQIRGKTDFAAVSALLAKSRADAMFVAEAAGNLYNRWLLAELAARMKLPAIAGAKEFAEAGGLMSYGANYEAQYRSAARLVDKILRGTSPADIPVEQASEFELVINVKTAKALGITIPQSVLGRADRVIE